jgi:hypothetical protein
VALLALFGAQARGLVTAAQAVRESYDVVQRASSSAAANAVSKLAARFAAGTGELARLVRREQDLAAEAESLDKAVIAFVSKPSPQRSVAAEDEIRSRIEAVKGEREKLQQVLNARFPDYVALSRPQPVSLEETQALLADDEALLVLDFDASSHAWIITRDAADWIELKIAVGELDLSVGPRNPGEGCSARHHELLPRYPGRCGRHRGLFAAAAGHAQGGAGDCRPAQGRVCDIKLGLAATETAVKTAKLDEYRIIYFATHGLVAGYLEQFASSRAEPALALTFPQTPSDIDDGLLMASEVAQLKLDADWAVLSACNTAAEDAPGAEALSGLARAFFYAGARSLIVSHWNVVDHATVALMSGTFRAAARDPSLSHAEALRQSMLAMIEENGLWVVSVLSSRA